MNTTDPNILTDSARKYLKVKSQVEILYSQSTVTFMFPVLFAAIIAIVIWDAANRQILQGWLAVVTLYAIIRYLILWRYTKTEKTPENYQRWLNRFGFITFLSGAMWGSAGIILIPYDPQNIIEFTLYNGLTMLAVCGLVAGAVISYSISLSTIFLYILPALVPPALYLISIGDKYNSALGGFILMYFFFIGLTAYKLNQQLMAYAFREYEYQNMKQHYFRLKKHLEEKNRRLSA